MSFEEMVRAKHAFEDRLGVFVFLIRNLNERQLELALAKLADQQNQKLDENKFANLRLKGELIQACLLANRHGEIKGSMKIGKVLNKICDYLPVRKCSWFLMIPEESIDDYALRCVSEFRLFKSAEVLNQSSFSEQPANQLLRLYGPENRRWS
jgi:hypothetical protein